MKTRNFRALLTIMLGVLLAGCFNNKKAETIITQWHGKTIVMPDKIAFKTWGNDTSGANILSKSYKVVTYVDSETCTSCQLGLSQWKGFIELCEQLQLDVGFLFIINSDDYPEFEYHLKIQNFSYPVIYDSNDEFNKSNRFPKDRIFRTFLLDKDNKIVIVGSPFKSDKILNLYISSIK